MTTKQINRILEIVDCRIDSESKNVSGPMEPLSKVQLMKLLNFVVCSLFKNDKAGTIELLSRVAAEAQVKLDIAMMKFYINENSKVRKLNLASKLLLRQESTSAPEMSGAVSYTHLTLPTIYSV